MGLRELAAVPADERRIQLGGPSLLEVWYGEFAAPAIRKGLLVAAVGPPDAVPAKPWWFPTPWPPPVFPQEKGLGHVLVFASQDRSGAPVYAPKRKSGLDDRDRRQNRGWF